jgi:hypothetical protein
MNNPNLDPLITDRTSQDVATRTQKGFYNVSDITRINSYIEYLSDVLDLNLTVIDVTLGQALTRAEMDSIISNINAIRAVWYVANDTPQTPQAFNWDYQKANDIEKILLALDEFYQSVQIDKLYSGTFRAGSQIKFRGAQQQ